MTDDRHWEHYVDVDVNCDCDSDSDWWRRQWDWLTNSHRQTERHSLTAVQAQSNNTHTLWRDRRG